MPYSFDLQGLEARRLMSFVLAPTGGTPPTDNTVDQIVLRDDGSSAYLSSQPAGLLTIDVYAPNGVKRTSIGLAGEAGDVGVSTGNFIMSPTGEVFAWWDVTRDRSNGSGTPDLFTLNRYQRFHDDGSAVGQPVDYGFSDASGDDGRATISHAAFLPDGNVYFLIDRDANLSKLSPNGTTTETTANGSNVTRLYVDGTGSLTALSIENFGDFSKNRDVVTVRRFLTQTETWGAPFVLNDFDPNLNYSIASDQAGNVTYVRSSSSETVVSHLPAGLTRLTPLTSLPTPARTRLTGVSETVSGQLTIEFTSFDDESVQLVQIDADGTVQPGVITTYPYTSRIAHNNSGDYLVFRNPDTKFGVTYDRAVVRLAGGVTISSSGVMHVTGTGADDVIDVHLSDAALSVDRNGVVFNYGAMFLRGLQIDGNAGDDLIDIDDTITLPTTLSGGVGFDTIFGGSGPDVIGGGLHADELYGRNGNDSLSGGKGHDFLRGGDGNDLLLGLLGNDSLFGEEGNDLLVGASGNDSLSGEAGNDTVFADEGSDVMSGGDGIDTATFSGRLSDLFITLDGVANDGAAGEADNVQADFETVLGGSGNDRITGSASANLIRGGGGNDTLLGLAGDDTLYGEAGRDVLNGGTGTNVLRY